MESIVHHLTSISRVLKGFLMILACVQMGKVYNSLTATTMPSDTFNTSWQHVGRV